MALRPSEHIWIRLCKKCSATQHFLLKHSPKKCLVATYTITYMQEIQICFLSSCWESSKLQWPQKNTCFIQRRAETFSLETIPLPLIDAPPVSWERVKICWAIERNNKMECSILLGILVGFGFLALVAVVVLGDCKEIERLLKTWYNFQQLWMLRLPNTEKHQVYWRCLECTS